MENFLRQLFRICILALVLTGVAFSQGTTITLLHVNDTHSHLDAFGPKDADLNGTIGGIAKAATVIGTVRAAEQNVLLLHAGDLFVGDLFFNKYFGVPELRMMAQMGFDAMTIGNHEFNFGPEVLKQALDSGFIGGSFPLLSANLDLTGYPPLQPYVQSSITKTFGSVKVGIFGLTTPYDPTTFPAPAVLKDNLGEIAGAQVVALRSQGAQVVVLLSHLGVYLDKIIAANVPGIDFIVGGHDHNLYSEPISVTNPSGGTTLIFQAGSYYEFVGKLQFTVDNGVISSTSYALLPVDAAVQPEPSLQGVVGMLKEGIVATWGDVYHTVVGRSPREIGESYDLHLPFRDTPLGNLITDAYRAKTGTELAITTLGLIAEKMYAGPIVPADIFRSVPYGFDTETGLSLRMATFTITGAELIKGLEIGLSQLESGDDYFMQVAGMRFQYDPTKPVGERVIYKSIHLEGGAFSPFGNYTCTVNTGLLMLMNGLGLQVSNVQLLPDLEMSVIQEFIAAKHTISYNSQGRIEEKVKSAPPASAAQVGTKNGRLRDGYPNPFNPSTTITYVVDVPEYVSVKIYNTLGQEVAVLDEGMKEQGTYVKTWDAGNYPAGVYFCRLQSGASIETRKLLMVK